jgi:pyruvate,water dikinase
MDIEWAAADGKIAILQARPITNLPPEWLRPHPKGMYARTSLAEHLPNPATPLFSTLGLRAINIATAELAALMKFDAEKAEYQYRTIHGYVFLGFLNTPWMWWKTITGSSVVVKRVLRNPRGHWQEASQQLSAVLARWEGVAAQSAEGVQALPPQTLLRGAIEIFTQAGRLFTVLQSSTLPAASSSETVFTQVYRMVRRKGDPEAATFLLGFDTVPLQTEKALCDLALWAKEQPGLPEVLQQLSAERLADLLVTGAQPAGVPEPVWRAWCARLMAYQTEIGSTAFELDFANPTPAEQPELALEVIKMYLAGQGHNPYERQRAAVALREHSTQSLLARLRWPLKGWFQKSLRWAQSTSPAREDCLVDLGRANPLVRRLLGELGRRLGAGGALETGADIYWLEESEVTRCVDQLEQGQPLTDLRASVAQHKATWQAQLKLTPPAMLPENSRWAQIVPWHQADPGGSTLKGIGASAGKVTAPACVLLSPGDFGKMKPGAVLVAVTTTPAWTPLFAMASAVVTDIGGPLSHGSIVAREYGIPAVMATGMATRKIKSGQLITVDGSTGTVTLESPVASPNCKVI